MLLSVYAQDHLGLPRELWKIIWDYKQGAEEWDYKILYTNLVIRTNKLEYTYWTFG